MEDDVYRGSKQKIEFFFSKQHVLEYSATHSARTIKPRHSLTQRMADGVTTRRLEPVTTLAEILHLLGTKPGVLLRDVEFLLKRKLEQRRGTSFPQRPNEHTPCAQCSLEITNFETATANHSIATVARTPVGSSSSNSLMPLPLGVPNAFGGRGASVKSSVCHSTLCSRTWANQSHSLMGTERYSWHH